jgi:hypothetical protein
MVDGERFTALTVMAGLVPAIHVVQPPRSSALRSGSATRLSAAREPNRVDGRDKPGHDGKIASLTPFDVAVDGFLASLFATTRSRP